MKKFLALALALVMALALAVPAMAFTADVADEYEYTLGIELVEWENDSFFGLVSAAPSDRGYAKNEIVAFIVTYTAQKGGDAAAYDFLKVTGKNVVFNVTDNEEIKGIYWKTVAKDALTVDLDVDAAALKNADQKIRTLGFAKVTGDDASITAEVTATAGTAGDAKFKASGTDTVLKFKDDDDKEYEITHSGTLFSVKKAGDALFEIVTDAKGYSKELYVRGFKAIKDNAGDYIFLTTAAGNDAIDKTSDAWKNLNKIAVEEFEGVFGFDFDLLGGLVTEKYFESLTDYDKLEVTVEIAPWVAYVQVPDVIVVDPPKTGDATVLVGIVMAIVAAAGVVVFNKVRA